VDMISIAVMIFFSRALLSQGPSPTLSGGSCTGRVAVSRLYDTISNLGDSTLALICHGF
jgi:hypothetical protein